ncbi:hypothetical protein [Sphingomonas psychrotolerans]|uniref:Uncharacterized protein n=1 Tax=Sphingomonas psychrotolerans TaxID=1327635 RepID=A0A2K8MP23_9SPHN|nr:hypothetical protein [Sphingomonas psychrotolerans]ATY34924.1 hypothetical protein CVN68_22720 [Sphingomonas psychrotolerans]
MPAPAANLSPKRHLLCSRENAHRVASRLFDARPGRVSIVRTDNPLQPFYVSRSPARDAHVEVEIVS